MSEKKSLVVKTICTLKEEGVKGVGRKAKNYIQTTRIAGKDAKYKVFKDVLFINGCHESVPHPTRYRVTHQREQLEACNLSTNQVYYENLSLDQVRFYRTFIFFRCPYTPTVGEFIELAKKLNKRVIFDIDDLVVDTKYTDTIKYLNGMSKEERELYDDGVKRMGKTLCLCDAAITTTERLAIELRNYVPEVFINRNTASEEMVALSRRALANCKDNLSNGVIRIGYFSGSLTHNDDFMLVLPVLSRLMQKYSKLELHVVGELKLPNQLKEYSERVIAHPFVDWRKLPMLISEVDINIAPLENSVFNEAKSENKWVEAALVKVPTVASNVGAFQSMIQQDETGLLCENETEWENALERLIKTPEERDRIAKQAFEYCNKNCVTIYTGLGLARFVRKYTTENIAFVLPSLKISGGIRVALEHASMLQKAGKDVVLLNVDAKTEWQEYAECRLPVLGQNPKMLEGKFDKAVATMWTTVNFLETYYNINERYYLVQNFETDFYEPANPLRIQANKSYYPQVPVKFITISKWCKQWLEEEYGGLAKYAPNGIKKDDFCSSKRNLDGRVRILIEGDCGVDYKNIDESFKIVDKLDLNKFEVWYMSYSATPKSYYRVDKFLHQIPFEEVPQIYQECDILLKTSILESFSYPPLEMMATGGFAIVVPNGGNVEYLKDEENCLLYPAGEIDKGVDAVMRICNDKELQDKLYDGGLQTALDRDWKNIEDQILKLYEIG